MEKVVSFIDNIIIGIEEEEGYDEVVKEVIRRLTKNNLYIKSEKYKLSGTVRTGVEVHRMDSEMSRLVE